MSRWFHNGGVMPTASAVAHRRPKSEVSVKAEVEALKNKAHKLADFAQELLVNVEAFAARGGLDHVADDDGNRFSDADDFLTRGLGVDCSFTFTEPAPAPGTDEEFDDE